MSVIKLTIVLLYCVCIMRAIGLNLQRVLVGTRQFSLTQSASTPGSILTKSFSDLTELMGGSGKAKVFWKQLRDTGCHPLHETSQLTTRAKERLQLLMDGQPLIPVVVECESLSDCGTRKLLLKLNDKQSIEAVIIPSSHKDHCTLCVSTQLGCDRRCAFCATGTMGLLRNLTAAEILSQVILGKEIAYRENMAPITNVVFMGMGDAGRNLEAVKTTVQCLTDRKRLAFSPNKISVSTVGPNPEVFMELAALPSMFAWSLHSPDDAIRKRLVPTTRHSTTELRSGLISALLSRSNPNTRTVLIAFTLIDGVNDSIQDAENIVEFMQPILAVSDKVVVNLIPYNDINLAESVDTKRILSSAVGFSRPSAEKVLEFQRHLQRSGMFCSVRSTRGEPEAAACGMLATKRVRRDATATRCVVDKTV